MRYPVLWVSALYVSLAVFPSASHAQNQLLARAERPMEMAGLYRVESPSSIAPQKIRFLRLLPDGRARWETLVIDGKSSTVKASVTVGEFSNRRWHLKNVGDGRAPHLCYPDIAGESCYAFHAETPRNDLLLFGPDANWGEPTIILRREQASNTR